MSAWRWYAAGILIGAAAGLGIMATGALPEEAQAQAEKVHVFADDARYAEWEPETVSFTMVSEAHIGPEDLSGGQIFRAGHEAASADGSDHGRYDAVIRRSEVGATMVPAEWDESDVELLARLLWSSPLRNEDAKRQLIWCVLNRVDDERPIFARTIAANVNRKEFTFFDRKAYLSETNLRVAREELERWTRVLSGIEERPVPEGYVYLRFAGDGNRMIYLMKEIGGEAL